MADYWTPERVRLFDAAVRRSDFPAKALEALGPALQGCRTALDVGAGVGSLTLPLARRLDHVTALEPSPAMRAVLEENLRRAGLANVVCSERTWAQGRLPPHDLVLVANVAPIFDALPMFLDRAHDVARQAVALLRNVGSGDEKFYFGELYPLLLGRPYPPRPDYRRTLAQLKARGIRASSHLLEYDFDQPFDSFAEALAFWRNRLRLEAPAQLERLTEFLERRLVRDGGGWLAPMRRRSAVIWWTVGSRPSPGPVR